MTTLELFSYRYNLTIWDHCVHTQRCKLTPSAREPLQIQTSPEFPGCFVRVVHPHQFLQHMVKYGLPKYSRQQHFVVGKNEIFIIKKALLRPPLSKTSTLTSASQLPCPHGETLQLAIYQLCFLKHSIQNRGKKTDLQSCSLQGMFPNSFHQCQGTMGQGNVQLRGFSTSQLETRNKMTFSYVLFNKQSTLLNCNQQHPSL